MFKPRPFSCDPNVAYKQDPLVSHPNAARALSLQSDLADQLDPLDLDPTAHIARTLVQSDLFSPRSDLKDES